MLRQSIKIHCKNTKYFMLVSINLLIQNSIEDIDGELFGSITKNRGSSCQEDIEYIVD